MGGASGMEKGGGVVSHEVDLKTGEGVGVRGSGGGGGIVAGGRVG